MCESGQPSLLELRKFMAPEFIFGVDACLLAGQYLRNFGTRRVLLVTDSHLRNTTAWVQKLETSLSSANLPFVVVDQVSPNPRAVEVMDGAALFLQARCNAILALGGGSVMDCAKAIGIIASSGGHIADYEGVDRIKRAMPPLICIPTTSGTASEVSQFSIITHETQRRKLAIVSKTLVPDVALLDPQLTTTMNPFFTACSGMDALTHAIEAYVSNASSPATNLHALEALRIVWSTLPRVLARPADIALRAQMLFASLQAGLAFSNAILGATHSLAHGLGGLFDLTHGECNAILLAPVVAANYSACPEKFQHIGRLLGLDLQGMTVGKAAALLAGTIENYRRQIGLTHSLKDLGVSRSDFSRLAAVALKDPCLATNPRPLEQHDLEAIYEQAL
ncbi:hypothetical protein P22_1811 [Propionispora sp. 2/2-37]|uniref:alcohol dehydrogenase-like regulatory protein ErcA n=1 Tax=Propionispora sp. 2/2-37 TaxID=1677858 RepID=UPI0006BB6CB5|nr:alcohol dehydrogenase-like regulatory protein ErcA [Propionispora sp. 2/2-37]CUH95731.1 hypothetical protein P22_1811 [Propionispora sp. 2/2-37]